MGSKGSSKLMQGALKHGGVAGKQSQAIINARALGGVKALALLGGGTYLATSNMSGMGPGDAAASMEQWSHGGTMTDEDVLAIAFNPAVYSEAEKQGLLEELPFTFQSEQELVGLADMIHDATEGGEKYFGKGVSRFYFIGSGRRSWNR